MNDFPAVPAIRAALGCRCPRCGRGRLFTGLLSVRSACEICGLDLSAQDAGDGPAVFVILFLGFVVVGLAALVEIKFSPPIWKKAKRVQSCAHCHDQTFSDCSGGVSPSPVAVTLTLNSSTAPVFAS